MPQNIAPRGWIETLTEVAANQIETTGKKRNCKEEHDFSPKISIRRERGVIRASMVLVVVAK